MRLPTTFLTAQFQPTTILPRFQLCPKLIGFPWQSQESATRLISISTNRHPVGYTQTPLRLPRQNDTSGSGFYVSAIAVSVHTLRQGVVELHAEQSFSRLLERVCCIARSTSSPTPALFYYMFGRPLGNVCITVSETLLP